MIIIRPFISLLIALIVITLSLPIWLETLLITIQIFVVTSIFVE